MNTGYNYFKPDSSETKLIQKCIKNSSRANGYITIIGGSNGAIPNVLILGLMKLSIKYRIIILVDPYGCFPHYKSETHQENTPKFSNHIREYTVSNFYRSLNRNNLQGTYIQLDSREFIQRYSNGVPHYFMKKIMFNKYSFVILSGNNCINDRIAEFEFFRERMEKESIILFTNIHSYPHMEKIHSYILSCGFVEFDSANSFMSYQKL